MPKTIHVIPEQNVHFLSLSHQHQHTCGFACNLVMPSKTSHETCIIQFLFQSYFTPKFYFTSPCSYSVPLRNISDNIKYTLTIDEQVPGKDTEGHGPQVLQRLINMIGLQEQHRIQEGREGYGKHIANNVRCDTPESQKDPLGSALNLKCRPDDSSSFSFMVIVNDFFWCYS